jgi:undecaprenyl-diphosphatase
VRATLKPSSPGGMGASAARSMRRSAAMWAKGLDESGRNFGGDSGLGAVVTPTAAKRTGWPASQRGAAPPLVPFPALRSMRDLHAIVEGIVQGLTEFLPISSTAHLRIVPAFFGWPDPGAAFTAVVQLGTMAAVLLYFRHDLWRIARAWLRSLRDPEHRRDLDARMGWYILLGTIPIGIFGLIFKDQIETGARNLYLIGSMLIVLGVVLWVADRVGRRTRTLEQINATDGVVIGLAQALALIPGVSRSGSTISAGLFREFDRPSAARYSFLLSVPAVVLSGLFELRHVGGGSHQAGAGAVIIATAVAFVVGYASIAFLLRYLVRHTMLVFVVYRVALGAVVIALVAGGAIS